MTAKSSEKMIIASSSSRNASNNMRDSFNNTVQINIAALLGQSKERDKGGVYEVAQ